MRLCLGIVLVLISCNTLSAGILPFKGKALKVQEQFKATINKKKAPKFKTRFITNQKKWQEVWSTMSPKTKLPKVDFQKTFIVWSRKDINDPNRVSLVVSVDKKGKVHTLESTTLIGFQAGDRWLFTFHVYSRKDVKEFPVK